MLDAECFEKVEIRSAREPRAWLAANHGRQEGVWLVTHRKATDPAAYVPMTEILDQLLCFGWIDGLRRRLNEGRSMQLITPRRHQRWTRSYKDRAARIEAEVRMEAPGRAAARGGALRRSRALLPPERAPLDRAGEAAGDPYRMQRQDGGVR
jgi:uncharacterized protein YdeI (YjbR/CyaY-like superfamily)